MKPAIDKTLIAPAASPPAPVTSRLRERVWSRLRFLRVVSLERRLLLVAAASLLPLAALSSVTLVSSARDHKARLLEAHVQTALTLSAAIDARFENAVASLDALASSPRMSQRDFAGLQQVSHELLQRRPDWLDVVVSTPDARQVMSARLPLTGETSSGFAPESIAQAALGRQPVVSGLEMNPALQQQAFAVHVPVEMAGQVRYVLTAVIRPESLADLARLRPVPRNGVVSIGDRDHKVVARSRDGAQWLGRGASGPLLARLQRGGSGWVESRTLDDAPVYSVYHTSAVSGWSAIIGMPRDTIDRPLLWSYLAFAMSISISVLLGLLAAVRAGRTILRPVRELESSALSVGRGEAPQVPETALPEVRRVGEALVSAHLERERALEREREARRVAESASKAKDEFLAMLGHELRNPLAAISTASYLLERNREDLKPLHANAAAIVSRQVRHLARMTDDLLDAGRIVLGKIALSRSRMNLGQAVQNVMDALRNSGQLDRHEVSLSTEEVWIDADGTRIEQIALNLITNAIKYTPQGGSIRVEVLRDNSDALLRVCDTGLGLDAELSARVFDLFVQGERSIDRSQGGLGIGLTLVRRLAELHSGSAHVESDGPDCGAAFTVRLPLAQPPAVHPGAVDADGPAHPLRVALIEDNEDVRAALRLVLEADGHMVRDASDGQSGLQLLLSAADLDVALIDIGLPIVGGLEIARRVRDSGKTQLVLIAMTGYGGEQDRARGIESGFDAYLVKPVDQDALRRMLHHLVPARDEA